jgi:hypothetical protein
MSKRIAITDFLTEREIRRAQELKDARRICEEIIKPSIGRINRALGQENDPMYLAYMVEYVISLIK